MRIIKTIASSILLTLLFTSGAQAATADIVGNFQVLFGVAVWVSTFAGFMLFANGVYGFFQHSKSGGSQGGSPGKNVGKLVIATFLVAIPWTYNMIKSSMGVESNSAGSVNTDGGSMSLALDSSVFQQAAQASGSFSKMIPDGTIKAIIAFVFFIGFIAFLSGIYSFKDIGDAHANKGAPILGPTLRVVGGIACMNIVWFGCIIGDLIGIEMLCLS